MDQLELLRFTVSALNDRLIPYALVGSFASSTWGEPRMTHDIDIVVDLQSGQIDSLCDAFQTPEFYVSKDAAREAVRFKTQFNVIHPSSGNKIDFMIAGESDWAKAQIVRRRKTDVFPGVDVMIASPEDVILGKLVYYREGKSDKHLRDIAGIVQVLGESLDRKYVSTMAEKLDVDAIWRQLRQQVDR